MLYHHQQEEEDDDPPFPGQEDQPLSVPSVISRLKPSVGIISENTEAELDDTAEVISRVIPQLESSLCHEITEYVFPKAALSKQNQWRYRNILCIPLKRINQS